jgi:hypothetical protein
MKPIFNSSIEIWKETALRQGKYRRMYHCSKVSFNRRVELRCDNYVTLGGSNRESHVKVTESYTKEFQRIKPNECRTLRVTYDRRTLLCENRQCSVVRHAPDQ